MSDIVLSASVRQNLLSLQSTADLLATTQTRLATGKKVNTALDNPTNYFTAQSLDSRASDINNLLDGIGNGVQVLQAANTGITSLQKLVDTAKSIANQALQTPVGYSKSTVTSAGSKGISANDLLGTTAAVTSSVTGTQLANNVTATFSNSVVAGATAVTNNKLSAYTSTTEVGTVALQDNTPAAVTGATSLDTGGATYLDLSALGGKTLTINGNTIEFNATDTATTTTGNNTVIGLGAGTTSTVGEVLTAIQTAAGAGTSATVDASGHISLQTGTGTDITLGTDTDSTDIATALGISDVTRGGGAALNDTITGATLLAGAASPSSDSLSSAITTTDTITVNDQTIAFYDSGAGGAAGSAADTTYLDLATATVDDVLGAIDAVTGATGATASSVITTGAAAGKLNVSTGTAEDLTLGGTALTKLGLTAGTTERLSTPATAPAITGATKLSGAVGTDALQSGFTAGDSLTINGTTINFVASGATGNDVNITDDVTTLLGKIDTITGGTGSTVVNGKIQINAGTAADVTLAGSTGALAKLGLTAGTTAKSTPADAGLSGKTLTIGATGGGTASTITFGSDDSAGEVSTLDELNAKLAANNLQASISTTGAITLTTTNDAASANIGAIGGTLTDPGGLFSGVTVNNAVRDPNSQATRASLVSQYNNVIDQIRTTAQDASFNGINLLNGDQLKLVFNETGSSTLNITGVTFDPAGLGLGTLNSGTDFVDNASTNKILTSLNDASSALRSQASALGSNLSVVQIRQDFSKNLINVLQTGSSNLTLADTNEEAANSQALSTRQSIAVSALALANQSQQSVLQLLR
ncbi:MAG: flagellin N-terminal helical domain-containing protein [Afipia sp.]